MAVKMIVRIDKTSFPLPSRRQLMAMSVAARNMGVSLRHSVSGLEPLPPLKQLWRAIFDNLPGDPADI
jgi:hypothetical protein